MIDKDAPHHPRRHGEEVRTVLPADLLNVDQPQIGLVHQRRRLKAVAGALSGHEMPGDAVEFTVHERHQTPESVFVALSPGNQQCGDLFGCLAECRNSTLVRVVRPGVIECAGPA